MNKTEWRQAGKLRSLSGAILGSGRVRDQQSHDRDVPERRSYLRIPSAVLSHPSPDQRSAAVACAQLWRGTPPRRAPHRFIPRSILLRQGQHSTIVKGDIIAYFRQALQSLSSLPSTCFCLIVQKILLLDILFGSGLYPITLPLIIMTIFVW